LPVVRPAWFRSQRHSSDSPAQLPRPSRARMTSTACACGSSCGRRTRTMRAQSTRVPWIVKASQSICVQRSDSQLGVLFVQDVRERNVHPVVARVAVAVRRPHLSAVRDIVRQPAAACTVLREVGFVDLCIHRPFILRTLTIGSFYVFVLASHLCPVPCSLLDRGRAVPAGCPNLRRLVLVTRRVAVDKDQIAVPPAAHRCTR
jgi:hypothetical protein